MQIFCVERELLTIKTIKMQKPYKQQLRDLEIKLGWTEEECSKNWEKYVNRYNSDTLKQLGYHIYLSLVLTIIIIGCSISSIEPIYLLLILPIVLMFIRTYQKTFTYIQIEYIKYLKTFYNISEDVVENLQTQQCEVIIKEQTYDIKINVYCREDKTQTEEITLPNYTLEEVKEIIGGLDKTIANLTKKDK